MWVVCTTNSYTGYTDLDSLKMPSHDIMGEVSGCHSEISWVTQPCWPHHSNEFNLQLCELKPPFCCLNLGFFWFNLQVFVCFGKGTPWCRLDDYQRWRPWVTPQLHARGRLRCSETVENEWQPWVLNPGWMSSDQWIAGVFYVLLWGMTRMGRNTGKTEGFNSSDLIS